MASKKIVFDVLYLSVSCMSLAFGFTVLQRSNNLMTGAMPGINITNMIAWLTGIHHVIFFYAMMLIILVATFSFMGKSEGFKIILLSIIYPALLVLLKFCISNV